MQNKIIPLGEIPTSNNNNNNAAGVSLANGVAPAAVTTGSSIENIDVSYLQPIRRKSRPFSTEYLAHYDNTSNHVEQKMWFGTSNIQRTPYNPSLYDRKRHIHIVKSMREYIYHLSHNTEDADIDNMNDFVFSGVDESVLNAKSEKEITPIERKEEAEGGEAPKTGEAGKEKSHVEEENFEDYKLSEGLTGTEAKEILANVGPNVLPEEKVHPVILYLQLLVQPMPIMIWIAIIVEGGIQNWIDFGILNGIQFLNATLAFYETMKAGNAVAALKKSLKPVCACKRDGIWDHHFDATQLVPGDLIQLEAGNAVPADCIVNDGIIECDESAMTGESLPVTLRKRQMAKMGATIARGECECTVVFTGKDTFFGRTAGLLNQGQNERSHLQTLLIHIMIILVILSLVLCAIVFAYLYTRPSEDVTSALSFTVVLIVASIPVAIEIVVTTTLALGSREMSSFGAIVSRLTAIEDMAGMDMLCSDKTGTLTKNKMMIQEMCPLYHTDLCDSQMHLLRHACMAARWEQPPKDALDTLVLRCPLWYDTTVDGMRAFRTTWAAENPTKSFQDGEDWQNAIIFDHLTKEMVGYERLDYTPFDPRVKRTEAVVRFPDGKIRRVTKGAPHVIGHLDKDHEKLGPLNKDIEAFAKDGIRAIAIAVSDPLEGYAPPDPNIPKDASKEAQGDWHLLGLLTFLDPPRDDTFATIRSSEDYGVPVRMVTGDQILIAIKTAKDLQMGKTDREGWPMILGPSRLPLLDSKGKAPKNLVSRYGKYISNADGFAQVYPEHKFLIVETFRRLGYKTGMTGDGVNDAPALSRADVGIAVAGATDAARAAADIILTKEGLSTIVDGMKIARKVFQRMKTFLTYRIGATLQLLVFFFIAVLSFKPRSFLPFKVVNGLKIYPHEAHVEEWPPFFGLPVLMLMIITLLNDGTMISVGYDYTFPSHRPEKWNLKAIFTISVWLGALSMLSSLLLLFLMLDSWKAGSFASSVGIPGLRYGQVITGIYLKVSVSDFLTMFSARSQQRFFFSIRPHHILTIAGSISLTITTLISMFWPVQKLDRISIMGIVHRPPQALVLWIWIFCILVFFIQDIGKHFLFKWMYKVNLFNIANITEHNEVTKGGAEKKENKDLPITHAASIAQRMSEFASSSSH